MLSSYPSSVLLVITVIACFLGTILRNKYGKIVGNKVAPLFLFSSVTGVVCGAILMLFSGLTLDISTFTWLTALVFGIVTTSTTVFHLLALSTGPMSLTTVFLSFSMVINALSGVVFWNEKLSVLKIIGIALMFLCFVLTVKKDDKASPVSLKWFVFAILCAVSNAGVGLTQKTHQSSAFKNELMPFLIISFFASAIISFVIYLIVNKKAEKTTLNKKTVWFLVALFIVSGICIAINNVFNLHLSGVMDSAIFFPVVNGAGLILNVLAGVLWFKEKLSLRCWIGVLLGTAATFCLCI